MILNLDRYKKDLDSLLSNGDKLHMAIQWECFKDEFESAIKKEFGANANDYIKELPSFTEKYQSWYLEAKVVIKQLLPDRLSDFIRLYEKPKLVFPRNCGQSEKLLREQQEDCHGFKEKTLYPRI